MNFHLPRLQLCIFSRCSLSSPTVIRTYTASCCFCAETGIRRRRLVDFDNSHSLAILSSSVAMEGQNRDSHCSSVQKSTLLASAFIQSSPKPAQTSYLSASVSILASAPDKQSEIVVTSLTMDSVLFVHLIPSRKPSNALTVQSIGHSSSQTFDLAPTVSALLVSCPATAPSVVSSPLVLWSFTTGFSSLHEMTKGRLPSSFLAICFHFDSVLLAFVWNDILGRTGSMKPYSTILVTAFDDEIAGILWPVTFADQRQLPWQSVTC